MGQVAGVWYTGLEARRGRDHWPSSETSRDPARLETPRCIAEGWKPMEGCTRFPSKQHVENGLGQPPAHRLREALR
jgi:hypothetical protein